MRDNDQQLGKPLRVYRDTKSNIEALSLGAGDEGCEAYATDDNEPGWFNGSSWEWGGGGGGGGDSTYTAAYASRPSPGNDGDLFLPNNGVALERDDGAAWVPWGPIFPLVGVDDAPDTWVNQNDSVATTSGGGVNMYDPAQGNSNPNYGLLVKSLPSTPYTITACFLLGIPRNWNYHSPIMFGWRASDGKLSLFRLLYNSGAWYINHLKSSSPTVDVANYVQWTFHSLPSAVWVKIEDDSTNRKIHISPDGQNWTLFHSVARLDFLTPTQSAWSASSRGTSGPASTTLISWEEA